MSELRSRDSWSFGRRHGPPQLRRRMSVVAAVATMMLVVGSGQAFGAVGTDQADYAPGSVVTISGDNSNDAGYLPGETVDVDVSGPNGYEAHCEGVADDFGTWSCQITLWDSLDAVGSYGYVATGRTSGVVEVGSFTDAINVDSFVSGCGGSAVNSFASGATVCAKVTGLPGGGGGSSGRIEWWAPSAVAATRTTTFSGISGNLTDSFATAACGTWTLKVYSPAATLQATDTFAVTGCDSTPPVITKTVTGTAGSNGWYTSNVLVTWTVTDPDSAVVIDTGCGAQSFTSETAGTTSGCTAHSGGGSASDSVSLKIDKTGPSATLAVTGGTLGSHGWYVSDVTVSTSGSDAVSDNVSCTPDQHLISDSTGTTFNGACTNDAGLSTNAAPLVVKLDETAPTISYELDPAANATGWNNQSAVAVEYTCSDATSQLDTAYGNDGSGCWLDDNATLEGLTTFVNRAVFDRAGNMASVSPNVFIDRTPPDVVQGAVTGTAGSNGWYTSAVDVAFTASDGLSGLKHPLLDAAFTLSATGDGASVSTGSRSVSDDADNSSIAGPLFFSIDTSAPDVACSDPFAGWSADDITVQCTASDDTSDLVVPGDASFTLSTNVTPGTETDTASIPAYDVCDNAGLCTTVGPWTDLKVDKKAPDVSCGSADGLWHAADVAIGCVASDGGSGLDVAADASFDLTTDVAQGTEDPDASTGSHEVCDDVNNCVTAGPIAGNHVDKKTPHLSSCDAPDGVWHNTEVTLYCTYADGGSGPASQQVDLTTDVGAGFEDANASASAAGAQACDAVANCAGSPSDIAGNQIDRRSPQLSSCDAPDGAWHAAEVTLHCTYTDGGSGPASQQVPLSTSVGAGYEEPNASASAAGAQACDAIANCADSPADIAGNQVDRKAPSVSCGSADGAWHPDDQSVSCSVTDGGSGPAVASVTLWTNVAAGTETDDASTGSQPVQDNVGNAATAGPVSGFKIDKKGPTISISSPLDGGSFLLNQPVTSAFWCDDGGSGLATCLGAATVDTTVVGSHGFPVAATDNVANGSSSTPVYSVLYASLGSCLGSPGHQVLQPVNADGSSSFKKGSTVPIKFRVCDGLGTSIGAPGVVSDFAMTKKVFGILGPDLDPEPIVSTTPDASFRWSSTDQQWIFNLNTKNLTGGYTYFYDISLNDGSHILFRFYLKS